MNLRVEKNSAFLQLSESERFYFSSRIHVGCTFERDLVPPFWRGAPIGRLLHRSYFFRYVYGDGSARELKMSGYSSFSEFVAIKLEPGQKLIVSPSALVGFSDDIRKIETDLRGLRSANFWCLGDPLPMKVTGPGWILLYDSSPAWVDVNELPVAPAGGATVTRGQLIAFPTTLRVQAIDLNPGRTLFAAVENVVTLETRWAFHGTGKVLIRTFNAPTPQLMRLGKIATHIFAWVVVAKLLSKI